MDDYDKFIKEQSDPQSHHHVAASTAAAPPATASLSTETTNRSQYMTNKILDPMETTSTQELHKLAQLEKEKSNVDMTGFDERRHSKEERK